MNQGLLGRAGKVGAIAAALASAGLVMLAGTAAADGELVALTPSLDFGPAVTGSGTYTKFVEVYNGTTSSVRVVSPMPATFGEFTVGDSGDCPGGLSDAALAPGATCRTAVQYTPTASGPQSVSAGMAFCDVDNIDVGTCPVAEVLIVPFQLTGSGVPAGTLTADASTLSFGSSPLQTLSAPKTVTLTNGSEPTSITGLSKSGPAADDYLITNDGCTGTSLAPHGTCTFNVRFAPSQTGERDAAVGVLGTPGNANPSLTLSGTGVAAPATTQGQNGGTGSTGQPAPTGPQGSQGPAGRVEVLTCKVGTGTASGRKAAAKRCKARLVSGPAKSTITATGDRATISRGGRIYATGSSSPTGGEVLLLVHSARSLRPGVYTLTMRRGRVVRRLHIRIG